MVIDLESSPMLELSDDEKIGIVATQILKRFKPAFEKLAKCSNFQKIRWCKVWNSYFP